LPFDTNKLPFDTNKLPFDTKKLPFNTDKLPFDTKKLPFNKLPVTGKLTVTVSSFHEIEVISDTYKPTMQY